MDRTTESITDAEQDTVAPRSSTTTTITQYQVVATRRQSFDDKMWQVPAITLAAQAVLLSITTNDHAFYPARIVAGFLVAGISLMALNLLLRQRRNEEADKRWLREFERSHQLLVVHKDSDDRAWDAHIKTPCLARIKPHRVWGTGSALVGFLGLASSIYLLASSGHAS